MIRVDMITHRAHDRQSGQMLLIGLMLVALVTTIVGTGVLRSTTSTQSTKQREESNKASEIARGLLEQGTNDEEIDINIFNNVVPTATQLRTIEQSTTNTFVFNDNVAKDSQYILYTTNYDMANNTFGTDYMPGELSVYYGVGGSNADCALLEIMEITNTSGRDKISNRYYTGSRSGCTSSFGDPVPHMLTVDTDPAPITWAGEQITFANSVTINISSNVKAVVVRPFYFATKLGFVTNNVVGMRPQGRVISSSARTIDGAERTETVYQAYPQIPLSLFATIF